MRARKFLWRVAWRKSCRNAAWTIKPRSSKSRANADSRAARLTSSSSSLARSNPRLHENLIGGRCRTLREERIHFVQDFRSRMRMMHCIPQLAAVTHAMREQARELLHLANRVRHFRRNQAAEISRYQMVGITAGRFVVTPFG